MVQIIRLKDHFEKKPEQVKGTITHISRDTRFIKIRHDHGGMEVPYIYASYLNSMKEFECGDYIECTLQPHKMNGTGLEALYRKIDAVRPSRHKLPQLISKITG